MKRLVCCKAIPGCINAPQAPATYTFRYINQKNFIILKSFQLVICFQESHKSLGLEKSQGNISTENSEDEEISKKRLEGGPESKKRRREYSVEENSDDQRKSTREVSPRKSSVSSKHSRKDHREKSSKRKDSKRSDGDRGRHRSERRENGNQRNHEKGRGGERKDIGDDRNQNKCKEKSRKEHKAAQGEGGRKESDKFGEMLSRSVGKTEVRKRSSKHLVGFSVMRGGEDIKEEDVKNVDKVKLVLSSPSENGRNVKDDYKEKVVRSPSRSSIQRSTHGEQDSSKGSVKDFASRGSVKQHDNWDGPACPKCNQICKNKEGLRNHVLSHYYEVFFEVRFVTILILFAALVFS